MSEEFVPLLKEYEISATVLPALAFVVTAFRLGIRWRWNMLWWDDAMAAFTSVFLIFYIPSVWLSVDPKAYGVSQHGAVVWFYLCAYAWEICIYGARLTMIVAILRIAPTPSLRRLLQWCTGFFVLVLLILLAQFLWVCETQDPIWKTYDVPYCTLGLQIAITELVTDILTDSILVLTPLIFLSRSQLKKSQRYRLYGIFGAGIATTIVSITQDILVIRVTGFGPAIAGNVMIGVSSIVSNLPVLVSVFRRWYGRGDKGLTTTTDTYASRVRATTVKTTQAGTRQAHTIELGELSTKSSTGNFHPIHEKPTGTRWNAAEDDDDNFQTDSLAGDGDLKYVDVGVEYETSNNTAGNPYGNDRPFQRTESATEFNEDRSRFGNGHPASPTSRSFGGGVVVHQQVVVRDESDEPPVPTGRPRSGTTSYVAR